MIRSKDKIYAEVSPENNVISKTPFKGGKLLEKSAEFELAEIEVKPNTIPYYRVNNKGLALNTPNRIVGTDQNGDLTLFERIVLPSTPPKNRTEVEFIPGQLNKIQDITFTLEGPHWYEIEVLSPGGGGGAGVYGTGVNNTTTKAGQGAVGTYYRGQLKVETTRQITVKIGTPGGGAKGPIYSMGEKDMTTSGEIHGGYGGKTPILDRFPAPSYANLPTQNIMDGRYYPKAIDSGTMKTYNPGGAGYNDGASGGYSQTAYPNNHGAVATGGGANGPYGGNGGSYSGSGGSASTFYAGCGGGAGGGFNIGGYGGLSAAIYGDLYGDGSQTLLTPSAYADGWYYAVERPKNYSDGGGGGGNASVAAGQSGRGGSGGGGGGGVYILSGDFELLVGGGGGGYGAGIAGAYQCVEATSGTSNLVSLPMHADAPSVVKPGEGNIGWGGACYDKLSKGGKLNTNGFSGKAGAVVIYRLED